MKANAPDEKLRKVHDFVSETAPNRYNIGHAIPRITRTVRAYRNDVDTIGSSRVFRRPPSLR